MGQVHIGMYGMLTTRVSSYLPRAHSAYPLGGPAPPLQHRCAPIHCNFCFWGLEVLGQVHVYPLYRMICRLQRIYRAYTLRTPRLSPPFPHRCAPYPPKLDMFGSVGPRSGA